MGTNKSQRSFERIESLKEDFRRLSTEEIASRMTNFNKTNEILLAYKQILKERGIDDYLSVVNSI